MQTIGVHLLNQFHQYLKFSPGYLWIIDQQCLRKEQFQGPMLRETLEVTVCGIDDIGKQHDGELTAVSHGGRIQILDPKRPLQRTGRTEEIRCTDEFGEKCHRSVGYINSGGEGKDFHGCPGISNQRMIVRQIPIA
jgi:hypothetical protein